MRLTITRQKRKKDNKHLKTYINIYILFFYINYEIFADNKVR